MPASPRRTRWRASWPARACARRTSAARSSRSACGNGGEEYGSTIIHQLKRLGCACDYESERFTMDEAYRQAVAKVFVALYEKGDIYRDVYLVNWCTRCGSAISDLEVEHEDRAAKLYYVKYPVAGSNESPDRGHHPAGDHPRRHGRRGQPQGPALRPVRRQDAVVPLAGREVPVIADEHVDIGFGTGALKITPGHDPDDWEIGMRHGLPSLSVIGFDGRMTAEAGEFAGLTAAEARTAVSQRLEEAGPVRQGRGLQPRGGHLLPLRHHHRAAAFSAVVHGHETAGGAGHRRRGGRPGPLRPGPLGRRLPGVDAEHPALVRQPAAVVGAPYPRLLLRRLRAHHGRPDGSRSAATSAGARCGRGGRARHLVQLATLALRHAGLARADRPAARPSIPPRCCPPPGTSSICGWRG